MTEYESENQENFLPINKFCFIEDEYYGNHSTQSNEINIQMPSNDLSFKDPLYFTSWVSTFNTNETSKIKSLESVSLQSNNCETETFHKEASNCLNTSNHNIELYNNLDAKKIKGKARGSKICQEKYDEVQETYGLIPRKYKPDGVFKKIKVHFLKFLKLRMSSIKENITSLNGYKDFENIDQNIVTKVNIEIEAKLLLLNPYQFYMEYGSEYNKILIEKVCKEVNDDLKYFLTSPLYIIYGEDYLNSCYFEKSFKKIKENQKNSTIYCELYYELATKYYVDYYMSTEQNFKRKLPNTSQSQSMD